MILNVNQTGFRYERLGKRTLDTKGSRDVRIAGKSKNKQTHSYTVQPTISRDGRLIGKLLICFQEPKNRGEFGPKVGPAVRRLQEQYGNVRVISSTSGNMQGNLARLWVDEVLAPAVHAQVTAVEEDTELESEFEVPNDADDIAEANATRADRPPIALLLSDAWYGTTGSRFENFLMTRRIESLNIPPGTTGDIQPLDVGFMRQYKQIFDVLKREAMRQGIDEFDSRSGLINIHSLLWNQLSAPAYYDLWRYAWHNTDPLFTRDELSKPEPDNVKDVQTRNINGTKCEHKFRGREGPESCREPGFIRCSHCGKILCLRHFLERVCFHEELEPQQGPSARFADRELIDDADDNEDDDFDPDLYFPERATCRPGDQPATPTTTSATTTTTSTRSPIHDELRA